MSEPDFDLTILSQMRAGVDYRFPVKVRNFTINLRPLSIMETTQIFSEVADDFSKMPANFQNSIMEQGLLAKKTIVIASTSDVDAKDPQITEYVLSRMTGDELLAIYRQYRAGVEKVDPSLENIPATELHSLVEELKKSPESAVTELSFGQLVSTVRYLLTKDG